MGEASSTAGCGTTGRRLANSPSALRSCSSPCSGRTLASGSDHFGPPTAPEQHGIGASTERERGRGQRLAGGIDGRSAEQRRLELKGMAEALRQPLERANRLRGDLSADAVAREHRDQGVQLSSLRPLRAASKRSMSPSLPRR